MNAKDQATLNEVIAQLKAEFAATMTEALAPLVSEVISLQQRSSNFAARVNASNKIMRGEITLLRSRVEELTPKQATPVEARISTASWNAATASLRAKNPGKTFFAPGLVRAEAKAVMTPVDEVDLEGLMDEEVTL